MTFCLRLFSNLKTIFFKKDINKSALSSNNLVQPTLEKLRIFACVFDNKFVLCLNETVTDQCLANSAEKKMNVNTRYNITQRKYLFCRQHGGWLKNGETNHESYSRLYARQSDLTTMANSSTTV